VKLILFDIDGTLILSGGAGMKSLAQTFAELFALPSATDGIAFHGHTDPAIVQAMARKGLGRELDAGEFERVVERYLTILPQRLSASRGFQVLPGAREVVEKVSAHGGFTLGLATGNFEPAAYAKLRRGGLDKHFSFGGFGSDSGDRVELTRLAVTRGRELTGRATPALVVGDTIHDVRCAIAAGADCLAVATGNASVEALLEAGAHWAVPTLADPRVAAVLEH
jgi:phosphoglycolate phosphatase-like HAD superfamily hydrolase